MPCADISVVVEVEMTDFSDLLRPSARVNLHTHNTPLQPFLIDDNSLGSNGAKSKSLNFFIKRDDLTGFAIACGSLIGGIICAVVGYFMAVNTNSLDHGAIPIVIAIIGFIIGFFLVHTVLYTIESGVATLFVCYAEDPGAMQRNRPQEYNELVTVAPPLQPVQ